MDIPAIAILDSHFESYKSLPKSLDTDEEFNNYKTLVEQVFF